MECLTIRPQRVETGFLGDVLNRHYGVEGSISLLNSEVEHTVEVELPAGNRLILKTSSEPQALESFRFQSSTIAKLGADPDFIVPQILATSTGTLMFEEPRICGYVQSRLDGRPVSEMTISPDLLYKAGRGLWKIGSCASPNRGSRHSPPHFMAHQMLASTSRVGGLLAFRTHCGFRAPDHEVLYRLCSTSAWKSRVANYT